MVLAYRIFQLFEWLMILKWLGTTELESKHNGDVLKTTGKKKNATGEDICQKEDRMIAWRVILKDPQEESC